jgi:hypothetical protein
MNDEWAGLALCQAFANLPWLEGPEGRPPAAECAMKAVCGGCPVLDECRQFVAEHDITAGFWAGRDRLPTYHSTGGDEA